MCTGVVEYGNARVEVGAPQSFQAVAKGEVRTSVVIKFHLLFGAPEVLANRDECEVVGALRRATRACREHASLRSSL